MDNDIYEGSRGFLRIATNNNKFSFTIKNGFQLIGNLSINPQLYSPIININGLTNKNIGDEINIFDFNLFKNEYIYVVIQPGQFTISETFSRILSQFFRNIVPNIKFYSNYANMQESMIYFACVGSYPPSQYYKIHISVDAEYLGLVIYKLMTIFCEFSHLFVQGKIILPHLGHIVDKNDPHTQTYFNWSGGSAFANIVLYPDKKYDDDPKLFVKHLKPFIKKWDQIGGNEHGRKENNLYFNQRLSKSLYFAYGADSSSKSSELEKLKLGQSVNRKFKTSNNFVKENQLLCGKYHDKISDINNCLTNQYNLTYDKLCNANINEKDVWLDRKMTDDKEITFNKECRKTLSFVEDTDRSSSRSSSRKSASPSRRSSSIRSSSRKSASPSRRSSSRKSASPSRRSSSRKSASPSRRSSSRRSASPSRRSSSRRSASPSRRSSSRKSASPSRRSSSRRSASPSRRSSSRKSASPSRRSSSRKSIPKKSWLKRQKEWLKQKKAHWDAREVVDDDYYMGRQGGRKTRKNKKR